MRLQKLLALACVVVAPLAARAQTISTVAGGGPINLPKNSASVGAPAAVRQDSLGNTYVLDNNFSRVYRVDHVTLNMTVFAGNGAHGFSGEGGPAVDAAMSGPSGLCIDANNNVFVADSDNAIIREILVTPVAGKTVGNIYTVAGVQAATDFVYGGDGGPALSANLHFPDGCSFDSHGNLYIADRGNNAIRVVIGPLGVPPASIPTTDNIPGNIYLFAGSTGAVAPNPPAGGYGANNTAARGAALWGPFDVFVDAHDNVFIADLGNNFPPSGIPDPTLPPNNNVVREVPATAQTIPFAMIAGDIYTVAGVQASNGHTTGIVATTALLNGPKGIFVDSHGNLFFADGGNQVIREVAGPTPGTGMATGSIYDVAGHFPNKGYAGDGFPAIDGRVALSFPSGTFVDPTGSIFIADSNSNAIRQVASNTSDYTTELISTFAGNGHFSFGGDGALAIDGELNSPAGIAIDGFGNLAIADFSNEVIRTVANPISTGTLSTLAGEPENNGFSNGGPTLSTSLVNNATGVFFDPAGNVFIADRDNCLVREITGTTIATIAGTDPVTTPVCGFAGATGLATSATLGKVNGVAIDAAGNVFISDSTNNIIWEVAKNTTTTPAMTAGHIYIAVGTQQLTGSFGGDGGAATSAQLNSPTGIFIDIFGNLFIADTKNNVVREVPADNTTTPSPMTAGFIYTVAGEQSLGAGFGGDGGSAVAAQLNNPFTMVADHAGNIFIADTKNQVIREVAAGNINTVAGMHGSAGFSGDGGAATAAQLNSPQGLALDGAGDLLVADSVNNRVRSITTLANVAAVPVASFDKTSLTFATQLLNTTSTAQVVTLTNTGSSVLSIGPITLTGAESGDFKLAPASTCGVSLAPTLSCTISVKFTPTANGTRTASVSITDGTSGSPDTILLTGTGGSPTADLSGTSLTFVNQLVTTTSAAQTVTLTNNGTVALTITGITLTGTNLGDYSLAPANTCGASLAPAANCTISVKFTPTATGTRTASVSIADNASGSPQTVSLTGTGVAPGVGLSGNSLTFAAQNLTTTSAAQTVTLTNTGTSALTITGITLTGTNSGDFALAPASTCGASLAASANCTISVKFTPIANGTRTASVSIADSATGSPQMVSLTGTGVSPTAGLSATTLTFAAQTLNIASAPQSVTLTNSGTSALTITGITLTGTNSGDFALAPANTCGASLAISANCTISVTFTPTANGARTAAVSIADNASPSPQTVSLTGAGGTPAASFNSTTLTFSNQAVSTPSAAQSVTLTNSGTVPLSITGITVSGTNGTDFAQTNTCGTSVAAAGTCTISVIFTPGALGARTATITVTDNAVPATQTITLNGTGVAAPPMASLSSTSLSFTDQFVGTSTAAQMVTLTNNSTSPLTITSIAVSGANVGDYAQTNTCGSSVAASGGKCTISVTFTPTAAGARPASITVTDNATPATQTVTLTGNGLTVALAAASNGALSQTVKAGQTATYNLQLSAAGGAPTDQISVTLSCSGAPSLATCSAPSAPVVVTPAAASTFSITVATTGSAMLAPQPQSEPKMQPPAALRLLPLTVLAVLLCIAAMLAWMQSPAGRLRTVRVALSACLVLLPISATLFLVGCASGGSSSNTPPPTPSTPAGTYTLTVTQTVSGKAQTSQLTLIVQ